MVMIKLSFNYCSEVSTCEIYLTSTNKCDLNWH